MRLRHLISPLALTLALSGCASLNSVSVTPIPANRDHQITAQSDRWIILGLNFDNDFADQVSADLSRHCPNGKVSGILTKDESYYYFLFFVVKHKLTATGYCGPAGGPEAIGGTGSLLPYKGRRGRRVNGVTPAEAPAAETKAP